MSRPKTVYDKDEIEEIIKLKLESIGNIKSKLTPNNVCTFNKELVENKIKRKNGELFKLYKYHFWCVNGYGYEEVNRIKSTENDFVLVGEKFVVDIQDILISVDKLHKKPAELSKRLVNIFKKDRMKIKMIESQNKDLNRELEKVKGELEAFKKNFISIFLESDKASNSLKDVMSIRKEDDSLINNELKLMFNKDYNILQGKSEKNKIIDIRSKANEEKRKKELEDEFFNFE